MYNVILKRFRVTIVEVERY